MSATAPTVASENDRGSINDPLGIGDKVREDREVEQERAELFGDALELFQNRYLDTVTVERCGAEIEFYRPVDATKVDISQLRRKDEELADRLQRGSALLDEWRDVQQDVIRATGNVDQDINEILEQGEKAESLARKVLSAHAVDESFREPAVWEAIFPHGDDRQALFEDFFNAGSGR